MNIPMSFRSVVMGLGVLAAFGSGCVVEVVHGPYEACKAGEACSNGTVCLSASYTSNGSPANYCSVNCTRGEQCPSSPYGSAYAPTCVVSASAGTGLCYDSCVSNFDCGTGTQCSLVPGTGVGTVPAVRICAPVGTGTTACGASGQTCCAGNTCISGLACNAGVCGAPVACGAAGQACCAGNACSGGLVCGASGSCVAASAVRNPYQKCTPTTEACSGGTTCQLSTGQAAGKSQGSFCTARCTSDATCPATPGGGSAACLNLTGTSGSEQCFRRCNSTTDCASDNTTCTMFNTASGAVQVCVPVGPRG